jgi:hypothetical protein
VLAAIGAVAAGHGGAAADTVRLGNRGHRAEL